MSTLHSEEKEGILVVRFADAKILDEQRIQQIGKDLIDITEASLAKDKKLVLNFEGVTFMSSHMIGKLVLLNKTCKSKEIAIKFCSISPNVAEVFKIMRLNKVFDLQKDEATALASFTKKGWFG